MKSVARIRLSILLLKVLDGRGLHCRRLLHALEDGIEVFCINYCLHVVLEFNYYHSAKVWLFGEKVKFYVLFIFSSIIVFGSSDVFLTSS